MKKRHETGIEGGIGQKFSHSLPAADAPVSPVEEKYAIMLQEPATNNFRVSATKNIVIDRNGNATIEKKGFKAFMKNYLSLKAGLTVGAKKMLDAGIVALTSVNHYPSKPGQSINTAVSISLEEYGLMRGYGVTPLITETPEEKEAENKRLRNVMCNIRKRANTELAFLYSLSLSWTEIGKRKNADYKDIRVLQSKGIRNGYIHLRFSEDMAAYLLQSYVMTYPKALQALDERNPRAYNVGFKLSIHHSIDNNRIKGTNSIIGVTSLIKACDDLPSYEDIQASKNRGHWERLIKEPLENALDINVSAGVIERWEYSNGKGIPLNKDQIGIPDYNTYEGLYVLYEMIDEPDQSKRLQRKTERIEKIGRKKKSKS